MLEYVKDYSNLFSYREIVWVFAALIYSAIIFYLGRFLSQKNEIIVCLFMIIIQGIYVVALILFYDTQPCSDYIAIWNSAVEMSKSQFTSGVEPGSYMYIYNWQIGIAAFESIIIRIFGENFLVLKIFSAITTAINNFLVYKCCSIKFNKKIGVYAYVTATLFIPWMLSVPQFTNHHIALTLLLTAMILINKNKWYTYLAAGVLLAICNVLRPIAVIMVIAAVCLLIYNVIKSHNIKAIKENVIKLVSLLLAFFVILQCFNGLFVKVGYTDSDVSEARIPYFKFQKGLYGYNTSFEDFFEYDNVDEYNDAMRQDLNGEITDNAKGVLVFIVKKMILFLGLFDYQFEMTFDQNSDIWSQYPIKAFYSTSWFLYAILLIIAAVVFWKKRKENNIDIFSVFFIGNTLVYIFIEAFSSYRFENYYFIIMLAAVAMYQISEKMICHKKMKG